MRFFDSHCHLAMKDFSADLEGVIARAKETGIEGMLTVGTCPEDWSETIRIAEQYGLRSSLAFSPHDAKLLDDDTFALLERLAGNGTVAAIGETGLDYHYLLSTKEQQISSFERHLVLAESLGLSLVVHSRDSFEDTAAMLRSIKVPVVIHCFTYGPREAERFIEMDFCISFSGISTFKGAGTIREAARIVPPDKLLIETDAPYLAPPPHRGKRCEPAFVAATAAVLADHLQTPLGELAETTFRNASSLFVK